ncbi:MAG: glycoside hydrolase family 16 protein [Sphingomonadales bacterium]|nr:glycoside hydrolase family 16 protein [Sphingomonadales bacterium]
MRRRLASAVAVSAALLAGMAAAGPARAADWQLVWADEFNGTRLDPARWSREIDCWGGGNDERQCYTGSGSNARVEGGLLVITARRQRATGPALPQDQRRLARDPRATVTRDITSARLTTRGKAAWRYGRIEVRARLPQGQGIWPAIWMLPEANTYGPWAASGEIDIMEAVNLGVPCRDCPQGREDRVLGTLHFGKAWPGNAFASTEVHRPAVLDGFHTFAVEWSAERVIWQVDGATYAERSAREWWSGGTSHPGAPFDQPFHLILNLAVGGRLPEGRGLGGVDPAGFPKRFEIDWVRVWQKPQGAGNSAAGTTTEGVH